MIPLRAYSCLQKPQVNIVDLREPGTLRRQLIFLGGPKEIAPEDNGVELYSHCQGYSTWASQSLVAEKTMTLRPHPSQSQGRCRESPDAGGLPLAYTHPPPNRDCLCLSCPSFPTAWPPSFPSSLQSFATSSSYSSWMVPRFTCSLQLCADVTCPGSSLLGHWDRP